jgi:hypothetical protein
VLVVAKLASPRSAAAVQAGRRSGWSAQQVIAQTGGFAAPRQVAVLGEAHPPVTIDVLDPPNPGLRVASARRFRPTARQKVTVVRDRRRRE